MLTLRQMVDGRWGGNFEVPTDTPDGEYKVKVTVLSRDGLTSEQEVQYHVDRTPPAGKVELVVEDGKPMLRVHSEAGLNEVAAYFADGRKIVLKEVSPGVYEVVLDSNPAWYKGTIVVVLKDDASNKTELRCTWPAR